MIRRRILTAFVVVMIAVSGVIGAAWRGRDAYAAQTAIVGGNAMKVSPVRTDLAMDPGTSKTIEMFVTNLASAPATLHAAINDFVASNDESGKPSIILDENQYAPSHSLKRFIVPVKDFIIAANSTVTINVVVSVPRGAAGGGYFGAVRFEPANAAGTKILNLSASVGSLILLKVNGDIKENLSVASFEVRQDNKVGHFFTTNRNLTAVIRFKNEGNVQVEPFGKLLVKKGKAELSSTEINPAKPPGSVLPDSIRRFTVPLTKVGPFGKYTLSGNFGYGSTGQLISTSATFYVVPVYVLVLIGLAILFLLFLIFVFPRMIRAYNRRVVRRAARRR